MLATIRSLGSLTLGIVLLLGAASLFLVPATDVLYSIYQNRVIHHPVQGLVARAGVSQRRTLSKSSVEYTYTVGGTSYTGSRVGPGFLNGYSAAGGDFASRLAAGDAVTVFVHPSTPSRSLLVRGIPSFSLGMCLALGAIVFRPQSREGESLSHFAYFARWTSWIIMLLAGIYAVAEARGPVMAEVYAAALFGASVAAAVVLCFVSPGRGTRSESSQ